MSVRASFPKGVVCSTEPSTRTQVKGSRRSLNIVKEPTPIELIDAVHGFNLCREMFVDHPAFNLQGWC